MAAVISDIDHDDLLQVIMEARLTDTAVLSDFLRHIAGDAALSLRRIHTQPDAVHLADFLVV